MTKHMKHPDEFARSLCGIVSKHNTFTEIGSTRSDYEMCAALYKRGMKAVERNGNPTKERKLRMKEFAEDRKVEVKYEDISDQKMRTFIRVSDIYALRRGRVYNHMNDTYPTSEDIENDMFQSQCWNTLAVNGIN